MSRYRRRYEVAEEVLRQGGSNEEIQRRVMEEFPNSELNLSRASKYRSSWDKYGHCRCRSAKRRQPGESFNSSTTTLPDEADVVAPTTPEAIDFAPVERVPINEYRILRDTALARHVKLLHQYCCQFCGNRIELPSGDYYAESHHVQPLGTPYDGPDVIGNILCLCPNHHAELDYGVTAIVLADLRTVEGHRVEPQFVNFHNERVRKLWGEAGES